MVTTSYFHPSNFRYRKQIQKLKFMEECNLVMNSSSSMNFCSNIPCNKLSSSLQLHFKPWCARFCILHAYAYVCACLSTSRALHTFRSFYDPISIFLSLSKVQRSVPQPLIQFWLGGPSTAAHTPLGSKQNHGLSSPCFFSKECSGQAKLLFSPTAKHRFSFWIVTDALLSGVIHVQNHLGRKGTYCE